jgi:hypothetical protein
VDTITEATARNWTLADIAESQNVIKRTAQGWLSKAKKEHGEIGEIVNGTRRFSEADRDILVSYATPPRRVTASPAPPEFAGSTLRDISFGAAVDIHPTSKPSRSKIHELETALKELAVQHHIVLERMADLESQLIRLREKVVDQNTRASGMDPSTDFWGQIKTH